MVPIVLEAYRLKSCKKIINVIIISGPPVNYTVIVVYQVGERYKQVTIGYNKLGQYTYAALYNLYWQGSTGLLLTTPLKRSRAR